MKNKISSNFFYSFSTSNNTYKKTKPWIKILLYCIIFLLVSLSFVFINFSFSKNGVNIFFNNIKKLFVFNPKIEQYPNSNLWILSIKYLWRSIKGVMIGTCIGFSCAFLTSTIGNKNIIKINIINNLINLIIATLRAFPIIFFIYLFKLSFSKNLAFILLISWFSWIWLHKYMSEYYNNINYYLFETLKKQGSNFFISFFKSIIYQINNKFISLFIYSFESNMRWNSLLGTLGFIGIGELINLSQENQFESIGIPVTIIIIFIIFLEIIGFIFNKFVLIHKSVEINKKNIKRNWNYKTIIKFLFLLIVILTLLISIISTNWNETTKLNYSFIKSIFEPNWYILNFKSNITNDIFILIFQTIIIAFIGTCLSIIFILVSSNKIFGYYSLIGSTIITIIRSIPSIVLLFIIGPLFKDSSSTICLILGIASSTIISKNVNEAINKLDNNVIKYFYMQGYSRLHIFLKYIIPKIKGYFLSQILFEWESKYRDIITYGSYGVSSIGTNIDLYESKAEYSNMAPFIWIMFFITILVIAITFIIKILYNKNIFYYIDSLKYFLKTNFMKIKKFSHQ